MKCALNAIPARLLRKSDFRVLLRVSIGMRRKSSPSSSSRSKAQRTAASLGRCPRMRSNTARPLWSVTIASPSIRQERAGSAATAATICGKRFEKLLPFLVNSRTPPSARRAMMRNPSCLIS